MLSGLREKLASLPKTVKIAAAFVGIGVTGLGALKFKEDSYRNSPGYKLVNSANSLESLRQHPNWKELCEVVQKSFVVTEIKNNNLLKHEDPKKIAEEFLAKIIRDLAFLENRSPGLDDKFKSLEDLPIVGNKLGSFGGLQIQPQVGLETFLKHPELAKLSFINKDKLNPSDKTSIIENLNLKGVGGVILSVYHYLDLHKQFTDASKKTLSSDIFSDRCKKRDEIVNDKRCNKTYYLIEGGLDDGEIFGSASIPTRLAMVSYNAGYNATINTSIQAILNEISILKNGAPFLKLDGSLGKQTQAAIDEVFKINKFDFDDYKKRNHNELQGKSSSEIKLCALRNVWMRSYEKDYLRKANKIVQLLQSNKETNKQEAFNQFKNLFLGESPRGSTLTSIFYGVLLPTKGTEVSANFFKSWTQYLNNRTGNFLDYLDPSKNLIPQDKYSNIMQMVVERILASQLASMHLGEIPTIYKIDNVRGNTNPAQRILGGLTQEGLNPDALTLNGATFHVPKAAPKMNPSNYTSPASDRRQYIKRYRR